MSTTMPPATPPVKPRSGVREAFGDMTRSLLLLAAVIVVVLFIGPGHTLLFPDSASRRAPVDYSSAVTGFRDLTGRMPLLPTGLPASWRATSDSAGRVSGGVQMHVGWATPGPGYAGLDESTGDPAALVASLLGKRGRAVTGTTMVGGRTWEQRVSARGEPALTRSADGLTVVVTGDAGLARLRLLAAALR